jgi:DNA-binding beta-propeller fold protein YncE
MLLPAAADGADGDITQKPGTAACVSDDGTGGACVDGLGLDNASSVTVSPDGENVYVGSSDGLVIFDRNAATGALTQKPGAAGCISRYNPACTQSDAVPYLNSAPTVSPDGKNVYVDSDGGTVVFDRNATTGALTEKPAAAGCVAEDGNPCDAGGDVAISPDGENAYVLSTGIEIFDRNTATGALTQKPVPEGCIVRYYAEFTGDCTDGVLPQTTKSVTISPDGKSVYVGWDDDSSSPGIAVLDRNPMTGGLTQKPRPAGCINWDGYVYAEAPPEGVCAVATGAFGGSYGGIDSLAMSPDGENVYAIDSALYDGGLVILDRATATGALTQKPGTAGCITAEGDGGACAIGTAVDMTLTVAVAPGGEAVYVASPGADSITAFNRNSATGALTQKPGTAGCVTETGNGGACADGTALDNPYGVAVSPDGKNLYAASHATNGVAIFDVAGGGGPIDTVPPVTTITKKPKKKLKTKKRKMRVKVSFTSEAGATFVCALDKKKPKPCSSPYRVKASSKKRKGKKHTISVRATDQAGNVETKPACAKFRVIRKRKGQGKKRAVAVRAGDVAPKLACAS